MHETYARILGELRSSWRFRWAALLIAALAMAAGSYFALTLSDQYEAKARFQVDTQSLLGPLLEDLAVTPDLNMRVQALTETLLNRENVERVAREADLLVSARSEAEEERILLALADNIQIDGSRRGNVYTIAYVSSSPDRAQQVVQSVLDILTEETLGMSMSDSATATGFIERQVEEHEERLRQAEQRLADFKRENMGMLPEQGGRDYFARLREAEETLEDLQMRLRMAENRRGSIQQELSAIERGGATETLPNPRLEVVDEQLRRSREALDELLLRYTESHPDVQAMERQIERQEREREQVASEPAATGPANLTANPVYQELKIRLNEWDGEIAALRTQIANQESRKENLREQVDQITDVETRLADLNRNYEVTRNRYQALLDRLSTAEISVEADASGGQLQFRLIDPPSRPVEPVGPPRDIYLLAMIPFGFGLGGAFAFLLNQLRPVVQSRRTLAEIAGRPVLGSVSFYASKTNKHLRSGGVFLFGVIATVLVGALVTAALNADLAAQYLQVLIRDASRVLPI